mgnify:CR=1
MRRYERIAEAYGAAFEIFFIYCFAKRSAANFNIFIACFSEEKQAKYGSFSAGFSLAAAGTAAYIFFTKL